jgi:hypothetical protein
MLLERIDSLGDEAGVVAGRRDTLPGDTNQRRLYRLGGQVARETCGRVEGRTAPADRCVPERRVRDEAVGPTRIQQRPQLALGAVDVEVAPDDRVQAGVPVPLVAVARRCRAGERVLPGALVEAASPVALELRQRRSAQTSRDGLVNCGRGRRIRRLGDRSSVPGCASGRVCGFDGRSPRDGRRFAPPSVKTTRNHGRRAVTVAAE